MGNVTFGCFNCGQTVQLLSAQKVLKKDTCSRCGSDLHCCKNCRHFDTSAHNQCRENQAEWVRAKDQSNFCDYFEAATRVDLTRKSGASSDDARKQWDSLFKK